jgi:hypothetical protein
MHGLGLGAWFHSNGRWKAACLVLLAGWLWLGVHTLVIVVEGNRDPSLPASTPCPVLTASMLPMLYQLDNSYGYHYRTVVRQPGLEVIVENRCFNGGKGRHGSVFLWVNNALAAFSDTNRDIYDCHGDRIFDAAYDSSGLKISSASGSLVWRSATPDYGSDLVIFGPENEIAATISGSSQVAIQTPQSPAADPRLIAITCAPFNFDFGALVHSAYEF